VASKDGLTASGHRKRAAFALAEQDSTTVEPARDDSDVAATAVTFWRVLSGSSPTTLTPLTTVAKQGFETAIAVHTNDPYVAVQALDATGGVLATSAPVKP